MLGLIEHARPIEHVWFTCIENCKGFNGKDVTSKAFPRSSPARFQLQMPRNIIDKGEGFN